MLGGAETSIVSSFESKGLLTPGGKSTDYAPFRPLAARTRIGAGEWKAGVPDR
jgi:hypothetical protein